MAGITDIFKAATYISNIPSNLGKGLGEIGISDAGKQLTQAHLNLNAQPKTRTIGDCATTYAAEKALPHVEGKVAKIAESFASAGQCNTDQWIDSVPLEAARKVESMAITAAGTGASQVVDFFGSAGEAQQAHKDTIKTLSENGFPGMLQGEEMVGKHRYEYHVDASGLADHRSEGPEPKVYLDPINALAVMGDDRPDGKALMNLEEKLKNEATGQVQKYIQDGGDYDALVQETVGIENEYLFQEAKMPKAPQGPVVAQKAAFSQGISN